jgi:hypothetical protein
VIDRRRRLMLVWGYLASVCGRAVVHEPWGNP